MKTVWYELQALIKGLYQTIDWFDTQEAAFRKARGSQQVVQVTHQVLTNHKLPQAERHKVPKTYRVTDAPRSAEDIHD